MGAFRLGARSRPHPIGRDESRPYRQRERGKPYFRRRFCAPRATPCGMCATLFSMMKHKGISMSIHWLPAYVAGNRM